jgi:IS30 family transposase
VQRYRININTNFFSLSNKLTYELYQSLTWNRGKKMAAHHKRFTMATYIQVYFCDPQSP